jgi:hypothetical protein
MRLKCRAADSGFGPPEILFRNLSKGKLTKNLYTKLERLTLSCRVTWAWSERVNLYSRPLTF